MREAVIVSTARTPIGKAYRGAFNNTHGAVLGAHAIKHAIEKVNIDPAEVEDVIMGCGNPEGATGVNKVAKEINNHRNADSLSWPESDLMNILEESNGKLSDFVPDTSNPSKRS